MKKLGIALATQSPPSVRPARPICQPRRAWRRAPVNCFASVWTWLNSTAADCPLELGPVHRSMRPTTSASATRATARPYTAAWTNGVDSFITKQSYGSKWLWTPNGISQSVIGIKLSQSLARLTAGWSLVGTVETGFSPYYWNFANAQRSQVQNNGKALPLQGANAEFGPRAASGTTRRGSLGSATRPSAHWRRPRQHALAGRDQLL